MFSVPSQKFTSIFRAGHPVWQRSSSVECCRHAPSSRLASQAPRSGTSVRDLLARNTRNTRHCWVAAGTLALLASLWSGLSAQTPAEGYGIGRTPTPAEILDWGVNIGPNGEGLPGGGATAREGRRAYAQSCARCHGPTGTEGPDTRLAADRGALASESPPATVGSYWPYATTLWDYINRAMPFDRPGSLGPDDVYGAVAYVLFLNDIIGEDDRIDASSLAGIRMPNRDGFVPDPRPDVGSEQR